MPSTSKAGAVLFAKGLERVARFYEQVVSLTVKHADHDHVVLESEHLELVIHAIPSDIASSITITQPPEVREDTPIKLFFPVASLAEARTKASALGGQLHPSQREWAGSGLITCDGFDPEGNVFQLRQTSSSPAGASRL